MFLLAIAGVRNLAARTRLRTIFIGSKGLKKGFMA